MIIDPLETIITWLETALTSASGRVAGKHRYGEAWSETQTGVSVHLDGGSPDLYAAVAAPRFEIRIYADDQVKVVTVWRELIKLSRENERFLVAVSGPKNALVHYFKPASGLSIPYDQVLRMDVGVVFFECMIAEDAVS
jgi:hypothetical protein